MGHRNGGGLSGYSSSPRIGERDPQTSSSLTVSGRCVGQPILPKGIRDDYRLSLLRLAVTIQDRAGRDRLTLGRSLKVNQPTQLELVIGAIQPVGPSQMRLRKGTFAQTLVICFCEVFTTTVATQESTPSHFGHLGTPVYQVDPVSTCSICSVSSSFGVCW